MRLFLAVFVVLVIAAGLMVASESFQEKRWHNKLKLEGNTDKIVSMLMGLPSQPIYVDSLGQVVIPREYFIRQDDSNGNPNLAALFQISDSSKVKVSILFNANKKGDK